MSLILSVATLILFIASLFIAKIRHEKVLPIVLLTACIAFSVYHIFFTLNVLPVSELENKDVIIAGKLCELPQKAYDKYYYVIQTDSINDEDLKKDVKIRISTPEALDMEAYDKIKCKVHLFADKDSESGLNSRTYHNSKGIYLSGFLYEYEPMEIEKLPENQKPLYFRALKMRNIILSSFRVMLPEEYAGLICGVLLGDKQGISEEVESNFRAIGVTHILAVSGLHVSIIGQFLLQLFLFLRIPRKLGALLAIFGIASFVVITGFTPSVVRAGVMCILLFISLIFDRETDSLNSLGLAVLLIVIANPLAAGDIGLLLSFTSTLGLIILNPKILAWLKLNTKEIYVIPRKVINSINATVSTTISAMLFTMPLSIMFFGEISIISPIANLFIILPSTIMIITSIIGILFYFAGVLNFLSQPFILISGMLSKYIINCADFFANLPFSSICAMQEYVIIWVCATMILIAFCLFFKIGANYTKIISLLSLIMLLSGVISYQFANLNVTSVAFLESGNGSSIVLSKMGRAAVITCGGNSLSKRNVSNFLKYSNVENVDYLLLSEVDKKISSSADGLIDGYDPLIIAVNSEANLDDKLSRRLEEHNNVCNFKDKAVCNLWDNVSMAVYTDSDKPFIKLQVNELNILISPLGGKIINPEILAFDYDFFAVTKLPINFERILSDYMILSMDDDKARRDMSIIGRSSDHAISLSQQGSVILDIYDDSSICIKKAAF